MRPTPNASSLTPTTTLGRVDVAEDQTGWVAADLHHDRHRSAVAAQRRSDALEARSRFAKEAVQFDHVDVSPDRTATAELLKVRPSRWPRRPTPWPPSN